MKTLLIYRFSHMLFEKRSGTRHSRSGKHGRLGHVIETREMSRGLSLRSILTTWVTVEDSSKCVFVLISMLGRVKNSHYSSCYSYNYSLVAYIYSILHLLFRSMICYVCFIFEVLIFFYSQQYYIMLY